MGNIVCRCGKVRSAAVVTLTVAPTEVVATTVLAAVLDSALTPVGAVGDLHPLAVERPVGAGPVAREAVLHVGDSHGSPAIRAVGRADAGSVAGGAGRHVDPFEACARKGRLRSPRPSPES
ncbi:hypothetical protein [Streptomyces mirabilis]|uniref:hypothetical protein n=1 Tax=Streptomyces mirabilis TaxID=68239 RepID=UPI0036882667